jgi:hypothetical protein
MWVRSPPRALPQRITANDGRSSVVTDWGTPSTFATAALACRRSARFRYIRVRDTKAPWERR